MTKYNLDNATIHVNGIHSSPIITVDFPQPQSGMHDLATKLVLFFKGTEIFTDEKHIVIKTERETFEAMIKEMIKDMSKFYDDRT